MSPRPLRTPEADEETPMEALQRQVKAQEEVLRDYKKTIDELRAELANAKNIQQDKIDSAVNARVRPFLEDLMMYQTLIKGWPKGKKLLKRLTRDPDPYDRLDRDPYDY